MELVGRAHRNHSNLRLYTLFRVNIVRPATEPPVFYIARKRIGTPRSEISSFANPVVLNSIRYQMYNSEEIADRTVGIEPETQVAVRSLLGERTLKLVPNFGPMVWRRLLT